MKLAAGQRLGRFELLRTLGRGAQATVWLAHDERLDREVAVKLLDPGSADLVTWLHEARADMRIPAERSAAPARAMSTRSYRCPGR